MLCWVKYSLLELDNFDWQCSVGLFFSSFFLAHFYLVNPTLAPSPPSNVGGVCSIAATVQYLSRLVTSTLSFKGMLFPTSPSLGCLAGLMSQEKCLNELEPSGQAGIKSCGRGLGRWMGA